MKDLVVKPRVNTISEYILLNLAPLISCLVVTWLIYFNSITDLDLFSAQIFLISNSFYILYLLFSSRFSDQYSAAIKAFVLMILIPVVPHLLINLFFSSRPLLVYPIEWRDSTQASSIEAASYAVPIFFINIFLIFARYKKPIIIKLEGRKNILFYLYVFQCIAYSIFSTLGHNASLIGGEYAVSESSNFLSVNSWNAMSIIALIFSGFTLNKNSRSQRFIFGTAILMSVFVASILYGKRADIFGLFLIIIALASTKKIKIKRALYFSLLSIGIFFLLSLLAVLRDFGVSSSGLVDSLIANNTLLEQILNYGYIIPSLTDFFSTMPMVLTYTKWDGGDLYFGMTYLHALSSIPPEFIFPFRLQDSATTFLQSNYMPFNGGMFLPAEIYFNFGILGVVLFAMLLAKIFNRFQIMDDIADKNTITANLNNAITLAVIDGFSRFILYGTSNFTKHLILIIFIVTMTHCAQYIFHIRRPIPVEKVRAF